MAISKEDRDRMFNLRTPAGTTERLMKALFEYELRPQEPPVYWGLSEQDWDDIHSFGKEPNAK